MLETDLIIKRETINANKIDKINKNFGSDFYGLSKLNVNSLSKKMANHSKICLSSTMDILCIDQIKLDSFFSNLQFYVKRYNFPVKTEINMLRKNSVCEGRYYF